jgi:hypothetical protein
MHEMPVPAAPLESSGHSTSATVQLLLCLTLPEKPVLGAPRLSNDLGTTQRHLRSRGDSMTNRDGAHERHDEQLSGHTR